MPIALDLYRRLPVVVRAALAGLVLSALGGLPWAVLVSANSKYGSAVPWAVPPTALFLWLFWRYARGAGPPRSTAAARRASCRANPLSGDAWAAAILAGVLGLTAVLLIQRVLSRLVTLPHQPAPDVSRFPFLTVLFWVLMSPVVAGVVEEVSFRGYLQRPIEQRHGPVIAILVTGVVFGFAHFTHPEVTLVLMPYYVAVAAVYGALAHLTDSILPSLVLHAAGNLLGSLVLIGRGRSEWQASPGATPLIWKTGADASFWITLAAGLAAAGAAVAAFAALAKVARREPVRTPSE
ncbi:MAG TPA: CPBP family intramembrane glutamic endopeptidase [Candidatus Saccharimonadales bacterium]|nr:CPBP family intramembrane glutamic endopeptidase [Candidatus Saccharimonadales bacterium]